MYCNTLFAIGTETLLIGGFIIQVIIVWISILKFKESAKAKIEKQIKSKVDKELFDQKFDAINDKIDTLIETNKGSHGRMKTDTDMVRISNEKQLHELKRDFMKMAESIKSDLDWLRDFITKKN